MKHEGQAAGLPTCIKAAIVVAVLCVSATANAEVASYREPLLSVYLQPNLSLTLPSGSGQAVTDVYGITHPTGALGIGLHFHRRFSLLVELEAQGWKGELPATSSEIHTDIDAFELRFLNYWINLRGRIMLFQRGRFELAADAVLGAVIGREDGERFRAEGAGFTIGAGPVAWIRLGNFMALSISAILESGWIWYQIESPQARGSANDYRLQWPRVLIGVGLHGIFVHRNPSRRSRAQRTDEAPAPPDPFNVEQGATTPPAPAPTATPDQASTPEQESDSANTDEEGLASPW